MTTKKPLVAPAVPDDPTIDISWQGPAQLDVETLVWDLPIKVFATNPAHATSVSLLRSENSCVL